MGKKGRGKSKKERVELTEDERIERDVARRTGDKVKDDVDDFHDMRDEVKFGAGHSASGSDSDEDMEQPETMLDLEVSDDDSSEEDSNEGGEEEEDSDEEGDAKLGWGKKKGIFYGDDGSMSEDDDEEMEIAEEEEAMRLQKEKAALLGEEDFGLGDEEAFEDMGKKKKDKKKGLTRSDAKLLSKVNAELDDIDVGEVEGVETLTRDLTKLSESEKVQVLVTESPELLTLLEEFKAIIAELRTRISPLLKKVQEGKLPTSNGVSFLELKSHLLLNYCLNFAFYILLKSEGRSVRDHPVVSQLVKIRTVLEKMKPIDNKLKYQIDKLMRTASAPDAEGGDVDVDALKYKPNPDRLMAKDDDGEDDNIYRAPRMAAVQFEDSEALKDKKERMKEKKKLKASKSSLVQALREEFGDTPEETTALGLAITNTDDKDEKERERYEEDNMIRLTMTKAEKKKKKAQQRVKIDDFEDFDDFGDLADVTRETETKDERLNNLKKKSLGDYINKIEQNKKKSVVGGDEDLPRQDREAKIRANLKRKTNSTLDEDDEDNEFFGGGGRRRGDDEEVEDEFYQGRKKSVKEKKQKKEEMYTIERPVIDPDADNTDGRRKTNYQIEKNKGLTPHRKKDVRNSRVKLRNKFTKAGIKRKSTVRPVSDQKGPYGGEATGIKANVARSVKIRN